MKDIFATHEMSQEQQSLSMAVRTQASALDGIMDEIPDGREKALAKTKLEEAVMWANKAIVLGGK